MMNLFLHRISVELADYFIVMQVDKLLGIGQNI